MYGIRTIYTRTHVTSYFRQVVDGLKKLCSHFSGVGVNSRKKKNQSRSLLITGQLRNPQLFEVILKKFSTYNLAGEIVKILRKLITNSVEGGRYI